MRLRFDLRAILLALLTLSSLPATAAEILAYLPQDTLSFALIRDVHKSNAKISKLLGTFNEAIPAPLDIAKTMTGLSEGLNLDGDVLFALLPVADPAGVPAPLFLLPVADYAKFSDSIKADATGEICRVTIAEEDVLVAKRDDYALLMNVEHRELMQQLLAAETVAPPWIAERRAWLAGNDVTAMVTAAGIAHLKKAAEEQAKNQPSPAADPFGKPPIADTMLQISNSLPLATFFSREVETSGVGLAIDDVTNSRLRWLVKFAKQDSESATAQTATKPFVGFTDQPYAFVGSGDLPVELTTLLPEVFTNLSRQTAVQDGRAEFTEQDWADVKKSYELWTSGLKGVSLLLTTGKVGEPLLSIFSARLTVDDTKSYLESLKKSFELSNKLALRSTSDIKLQFEIAPLTVAGAEGIEVTCDLDKATGDGDQHIWQALLTSIVGVDHKLSMYFVATDKQQVFFAMESQDKLAAFIEAWRKQDTSLAQNALAKQTIELLEKDTPWPCLANPQGFVELVQTIIKSVQILGFVPDFPAYPTAPPLGLTLSTDASTWQGELVMPAEAARAMAQFTKEIDAAFR